MGGEVCPIPHGSQEAVLEGQANDDSHPACYLLERGQLFRTSTPLANSVL